MQVIIGQWPATMANDRPGIEWNDLEQAAYLVITCFWHLNPLCRSWKSPAAPSQLLARRPVSAADIPLSAPKHLFHVFEISSVSCRNRVRRQLPKLTNQPLHKPEGSRQVPRNRSWDDRACITAMTRENERLRFSIVQYLRPTRGRQEKTRAPRSQSNPHQAPVEVQATTR